MPSEALLRTMLLRVMRTRSDSRIRECVAGKDDYQGLAASVQGDYRRTAQVQCGRAVYERLGGTALWFVKDCKGKVGGRRGKVERVVGSGSRASTSCVLIILISRRPPSSIPPHRHALNPFACAIYPCRRRPEQAGW